MARPTGRPVVLGGPVRGSLHPAATAHLFGTVAGVALAAPPRWMTAAALLWLLPAALPPITASAIYFVGIHAPHHVAALVADPRRAPWVASRADALRRALPVTALTLLLGAALWPAYTGGVPDRLLELTLPHMLLDAWAGHAR